ncbi:3-oxo-tetronate kinase [Methylopila henanensis]|uniref:3-oxo-tetronate kinase n=1 Tax=Methylopila henanensis TaxID=873516 RepID=A0ABW4K500_9HYPH
MFLGCIADDLTGATDLALMLAREGLRTVQANGLPTDDLALDGVDAVVVALKSRTIPAAEAVEQSLAAADRLLALGAQRLFFKYCSTFDSTDEGNIGPVADALLDRLGARFTIACPAFPANGRTIEHGLLYVNGTPLAESSMKDHPLTPMRDSDLVAVLGRQTARKVGLVDIADVGRGADAIRAAFAREEGDGKAYAIVDAVRDEDLRAIGAASADLPLITGGSGVAMGLPAAWREAGLVAELFEPAARLEAPSGRRVILAGSCSTATRGQVAAAREAGVPDFKVDPRGIASGAIAAEDVTTWVVSQKPDGLAMVWSSADPEEVKAAQAELGRDAAGALVEGLLGEVASALADRGFTRFLVAGGETSGAVVQALKVDAFAIGPEIDPGVPWTRSVGGRQLALALKSGNFGAPDFFLKAWEKLA